MFDKENSARQLLRKAKFPPFGLSDIVIDYAFEQLLSVDHKEVDLKRT